MAHHSHSKAILDPKQSHPTVLNDHEENSNEIMHNDCFNTMCQGANGSPEPMGPKCQWCPKGHRVYKGPWVPKGPQSLGPMVPKDPWIPKTHAPQWPMAQRASLGSHGYPTSDPMSYVTSHGIPGYPQGFKAPSVASQQGTFDCVTTRHLRLCHNKAPSVAPQQRSFARITEMHVLFVNDKFILMK